MKNIFLKTLLGCTIIILLLGIYNTYSKVIVVCDILLITYYNNYVPRCNAYVCMD